MGRQLCPSSALREPGAGPYTDPSSGQTVQGNGRKFDHPGVMLLAYTADHKISKVDIYWDRLTVDQQLDVKPE